MPESELGLLQSLETVLEESRRLRKDSALLLEKAQWPEIEAAPQEESSPPVPDPLRIPVPPLLGFQRDKGNLPLDRSTRLLEPDLGNTPPKQEPPAGQNPASERGGELPESGIPEIRATDVLL